jgi:hypothetical protein
MRRFKSRNRRPNFLLYAIGEVILVMLGILLALQVNNWNNERLERKSEQKILQDLKVEFEANLSDAERVSQGHKDIVSAMQLIQDLSVSRNTTPRVLDSLVYFISDWFVFTPKPGASNNLINAGKLDLIHNEELRNKLTLWSGVVDELLDDELYDTEFNKTVLAFLTKNYPLVNTEKYYINVSNDGSQKLDYLRPTIITPYNVRLFLSNREFQSLVSFKKVNNFRNALEAEVVIANIKDILILIENEIKTPNHN